MFLHKFCLAVSFPNWFTSNVFLTSEDTFYRDIHYRSAFDKVSPSVKNLDIFRDSLTRLTGCAGRSMKNMNHRKQDNDKIWKCLFLRFDFAAVPVSLFFGDLISH